jgi:DNA polymerase delta subunit 1
LDRRKQAKKDMKAARDGNLREIQNRRQLALKVTANSLYGFTGVSNGMLPCKPIAATVTNRGRELIALTQKLVLEHVPDTKMLYGDTDSVMFLLMSKLPTVDETIRNAIRVGTEVGEWITAKLQRPHNLEFEKVARRFALFGKKRYWMRAVTSTNDLNGYLDIKGDETVRRDSCALMVESGKRVQQLLMYQTNPQANIMALLREYTDQMVQGTIDMSKLVISKSLNSTAENLAQVHVASKITARIKQEQSQREPPRSGDRVDFVIMKMPCSKVCKYYQKAEDPDYVRQYNIPLDMLYYMEKQFWNALRRKLEVLPNTFLVQCDDIIHECRQRLVLQNRVFAMQHEGLRHRDISSYFVSQGDSAPPMHPRAKRSLTDSAYTSRKSAKRQAQNIRKFFESD